MLYTTNGDDPAAGGGTTSTYKSNFNIGWKPGTDVVGMAKAIKTGMKDSGIADVKHSFFNVIE